MTTEFVVPDPVGSSKASAPVDAAAPSVAAVPSGAAVTRAKLLSNNLFFAGLLPGEIEQLAAATQERAMQRGEVLFRRGDPGSTWFAVLAGELRISVTARDGREQVLRLLKPGDMFGEMALLDGRPRSADATALTGGRLLLLERRALIAAIEREPALALRLLAMLSDRLRSTSAQLEAMLFHDVATRLAATLLRLTEGRPGRRIDITQSALAEIIGTARETVNKRLREWQAQRLVTLTPGRVVVSDPEGLARTLPDSIAEA